jgi:hypothetical protein
MLLELLVCKVNRTNSIIEDRCREKSFAVKDVNSIASSFLPPSPVVVKATTHL